MKKSLILLFLLAIMLPSYVFGHETFRVRYDDARAIGAYEAIVKPSLYDVAIAQFKKTMASNTTTILVNTLPKTTKGFELLTPQQANEKYKIGDLEFDKPISENIAKDLYDRKFKELKNKEIIRLGPKGITTEIVKFLAFLCALILDPFNFLAIFFIIFYFTDGFRLRKVRVNSKKSKTTKEISDNDMRSESVSALILFIISFLVILVIFMVIIVKNNPKPPPQSYRQADKQVEADIKKQEPLENTKLSDGIHNEFTEATKYIDVIIYLSAKDFHKTLQEKGVQGVILHSDECYKNIAILNKSLIYCIAFDTLASYTIQSIERTENFPLTPYFENSLYQERVRRQLMEKGIIDPNEQNNIISYLKYATRKAHAQIMVNE